MLYWLHQKARSLDINKWPVGGSRLGTIGNIVYGSYSYSETFSHYAHVDPELKNFPSQDLCEHLFSCLQVRLLADESTRMGSVNLVVIVESMRSIIDHGSNDLNEFHLPSLIAVGAALGAFFYYVYAWLYITFIRIALKV